MPTVARSIVSRETGSSQPTSIPAPGRPGADAVGAAPPSTMKMTNAKPAPTPTAATLSPREAWSAPGVRTCRGLATAATRSPAPGHHRGGDTQRDQQHDQDGRDGDPVRAPRRRHGGCRRCRHDSMTRCLRRRCRGRGCGRGRDSRGRSGRDHVAEHAGDRVPVCRDDPQATSYVPAGPCSVSGWVTVVPLTSGVPDCRPAPSGPVTVSWANCVITGPLNVNVTTAGTSPPARRRQGRWISGRRAQRRW